MNVLLVDDEPLELEQLEYLIHPLFPFGTCIKQPIALKLPPLAKR